MSKTHNLNNVYEAGYYQNVKTQAYRTREDREYQEWRKKCLKRDKYKCKCCQSKRNLHVHHIYDWLNYPLVRFDKDNGITLCASCHMTLHEYLKRKEKPKLLLIKRNTVNKPQRQEKPRVIAVINTHMGRYHTSPSPYEKILHRKQQFEDNRKRKYLKKRAKRQNSLVQDLLRVREIKKG